MNTNTKKKGFTLVEIMIVVVIIGLLAAMAVPAFQKVRENSQSKAITNNLRQVAHAGAQYILEVGSDSVTYDLLVSNQYLNEIEPVAEETYNAITITTDSTSITAANQPTGLSVKYTY